MLRAMASRNRKSQGVTSKISRGKGKTPKTIDIKTPLPGLPVEAINRIISTYQAQDKMSARILRQVANPGAQDPKPLPCFSPFSGASRHFRRVFTLTQTASHNFGFVVRPSITDFVAIGDGSAATGQNTNMKPGEGASVSLAKMSPGDVTVAALYDINNAYKNQLAILHPDTAVGLDGVCQHFATYANAPVTLTVRAAGSAGCRGTVRQYASNVLVKEQPFVNMGSYAFSLAAATATTIQYIVNAGWINWSAVPSGNDLVTSDLNIGHMSVVSDKWIDRGDVARWRVSAFSVLVSYRGNMLEGAGNIASALCRGVPAVNETDTLYQALAKLPEKSYRGPLMNGTYAFWVPQDLTEMDFSPGDDILGEETGIWVAGNIGDPQGVLEVTIDMVVEFYSPLQLFEKRVFPMMDDACLAAYHYLSVVNPCMCNPTHLEDVGRMIRQGLKKASGKAADMAKFAASNPAFLRTLAEAVSAVGALL